ncbi:MAG: hypothetical protein WDO73_32560 [Ignavibacteriota bacterium]
MVVEPAEVRAQVERVVRSKAFEASEVHRHLLQYLAEKAIQGDADRLKEYTIGLEAFGKPDSYDPRRDSIVRLQVGRLRQKLTAYYDAEAAPGELSISLPKGAFKLAIQETGQRSPDESDRLQRRRTMILTIALAVAVIWAATATALWISNRRASTVNPWTPELEALWAPTLSSQRSLVLCLGTPLFIRLPDFGFFRDPRANDWDEIGRSERITQFRKFRPGADINPSYSFTGAGEATAAVLLGKLLASRKSELLVTRSNLLSWQQISDNDVIFVGPPKFNRQLQTAALTQDIVVEPDGIRNLKPRAGEPAYLEDHIVQGKIAEGETHVLISRIPGISGVGELLIISGNASPDTLAGAEWLTQPWRARQLVQHLRGTSGEIPRYFQAVIQVSFRQGIPVSSSYVFHHVVSGNARTP